MPNRDEHRTWLAKHKAKNDKFLRDWAALGKWALIEEGGELIPVKEVVFCRECFRVGRLVLIGGKGVAKHETQTCEHHGEAENA